MAEFLQVKTGIAGDKYFEVVSGLKDGDQVITGPFNSVRDLQDGDKVKLAEEGRARSRATMTQFFEAIKLALSSVWANKLRSFMMVLGNIVAVTSIIAVVSLIQGMNSYVADALVSEVGIGTFRVDRVGVITDEEQEREAFRRNPVITRREARSSARPTR